MSPDRTIIFYHAPNTRSTATRILLEELGASCETHVLNMKAGEQRTPAYLAVNPMGKVPAVKHGDALITEQVAIFLYLADLYSEVGLAPPVGAALRGPYLRWMVYYASCFEPAVTDRALKRDPAPQAMCPYGDYDTMLKTVVDRLAKGPYILGERFSAADLLWGTALTWMTAFKLVPGLPEITAYIGRVNDRPAAAKVKESDMALAAAQEASSNASIPAG